MKLPTTLALLLALVTIARADDGPKNVQIDVEFIDVPDLLVTEILHSPNPPKSGSAWRATIDKLVKEDKAHVASSLSVTTKSGQRSTAESVQELTYPVEFVPAKGRAKQSPAVPAQVTGSDIASPTAFEMRPVGTRLEVDPTVGPDGKTIDLNIASDITTKVGETVHQEIPNGTEMLASIKQPVFHTAKTTTSLAVADGGTALAAILIPHNDEGVNDDTRRLLCLVTARLMEP